MNENRYITKNCRISYNPHTGIEPLSVYYTELANMFSETLGNKTRFYNGEETALVINGKFYILEGDFRKHYSKCKTKADAIKVFKKNIKHISNWSNDINE